MICKFVPQTEEDKKAAQHLIQCILNALEAWMLLMICKGQIGAIGTTDKAAMGYYLVRWLSKPYTLQEDTEGMSGVIDTGVMVVDIMYFNHVECTPYWYMPMGGMIVIKVRHVLQMGLQLQEISTTNKLPQLCNTAVAMQQ
jgi:hypothetical protein